MSEQSGSEPTVVVERRSGGGLGLFLLGAAVGAGIALLYAPRSGAETRQDLRRGSRRFRRKARAMVEEGREVIDDVAGEVRERASEVVETTRTAARDAAREAREALERRLARHGRGSNGADDAEDAGV